MKVIIDRFEGKFAVCEKEDGSMMNIGKKDIPYDAKEGDVLNIEGDRIVVDARETEKRRSEIEKLTEDMFQE